MPFYIAIPFIWSKMSWQGRDIVKLTKLINSLGLKLNFKQYVRGGDMAYYVSGESITVFVTDRMSKTEIILSLMHELGHHFDWIANGTNKEIEKAFSWFETSEFKKYSKVILDAERAGIKRMETIHEILDLEIPLKTVKRQQKIDLFHYKFFQKNKRFPRQKEVKRFRKRVSRMYV